MSTEENGKAELFERMPIAKAVMQLSIPTVLSSLVMVIYNLADTYFVGMLNNPVETAAVTLAAPVMLAFNAINNLFGVGSSSMMSRALGVKDYEQVRRVSAFGFYCALCCSLIFSLLCTGFRIPLLQMLGADERTFQATMQYLTWTVLCGAAPAILNVVLAYLVRAEGASLHASIGTMSGCLLNIVLDPIFILPWGLNMGAAGAGLATFLSNCVACLYFFVLIRRKRGNTFVCLSLKKFSLRKDVVRGVCAVGIPASIQNLLNVTGMTILNNFASSYGADAVAAMGIAQKINSVPTQVAMGFSQGIMPLVSYNFASGNRKRMKESITYTIKLVIPVLTGVAVLYFVGSNVLIRLFMKNPDIIAIGSRFLRGFCLGMPFLCMDFLAVGVFQAIGWGKASFVFAVLRKVVLEIPALFVLNFLFPLYGLAFAQASAEVVLAIAAVILLKGIFEGRMGAKTGRI